MAETAEDPKACFPAQSRRPEWLRRVQWFQPALESGLAGLIAGLVDVHCTESLEPMIFVFLTVAFAAGVRHAGRAWHCWIPLGASMYLVHLVAIGLGYRPPYVEADAIAARMNLMLFFYPTSLGLILGAGVRFGLAALGQFPRAGGPPVRLIPQSTRQWITTIVGVAIFLQTMKWLAFEATTVYAPGFNERQFEQVQVGETFEQVKAKLGPPIKEERQSENHCLWAYSIGASVSTNYRRYWIIFDDDKVAFQINDIWWD